ncbi:MAG: hypothetical protein ACN4EJ_05170 [Porticoccaceae bacterium]
MTRGPRLVTRGGNPVERHSAPRKERATDEIESLLAQLEQTQSALVAQLRSTATAVQQPEQPAPVASTPQQPKAPAQVKTSDKLQIPALSKSVVHEINRQLREMQKFAESQHQLFSGQPSVDALTQDHLNVVIDKVVERYLPGLRRLLKEKIADAVEIEHQRLAAEKHPR